MWALQISTITHELRVKLAVKTVSESKTTKAFHSITTSTFKKSMLNTSMLIGSKLSWRLKIVTRQLWQHLVPKNLTLQTDLKISPVVLLIWTEKCNYNLEIQELNKKKLPLCLCKVYLISFTTFRPHSKSFRNKFVFKITSLGNNSSKLPIGHPCLHILTTHRLYSPIWPDNKGVAAQMTILIFGLSC